MAAPPRQNSWSISCLNEKKHRLPGVRLTQLHGYSRAALEIYLNQHVASIINTVLGEQSLATQSLTFEWGSTQQLHRDPWYVFMTPPSHLFAAWVALEDVTAESGPLLYVPKSHRLPFYEFKPGDIRWNANVYPDQEHINMVTHMRKEMDKENLKVQTFLPKKGQVLM